METALVFGGTRFFGVSLVETLLEKGVQVTVATRQNSGDSFGDKVERLKVDRFDETSIKAAVEGKTWDVVFDQLCYTSTHAEIATRALEGKVKRYVFTSSGAVYDPGVHIDEEYFDPYTYKLKMVKADEVSYGEGKRQAEAYFFQKASFPVVALRIPIVLGMEDYTERLLHYVRSIKEEKSVFLPNPEAEMRFIHQEEAGQFLAWVAGTDFAGPINACAIGPISMRELMELIGKQIGKEVMITMEDEMESPYGVQKTRYMNTEKATRLGYAFSALEDWLPKLIVSLSNTIHSGK